MAITQDELDDFHRFATRRLGNGGSYLDIDDLVIEWDSSRNRASINEGIQEGLADIEAGRTRPAAEMMSELRSKYNLSE